MKNILVVDDNSVCLSLAKGMLSDRYNVFAVLSGEQAIKFLEKRGADLILLDINMPDMSGFEALKLIKENPATKDVPIIFLTADSDPETERKCFEMGAYDFIVKPFQKATLRSRIGRTLDFLDLQKNLEDQLLEKTKQIARLSLKSMMIIANTVDKKDPLASDHSTHVAWFAVEIAKRLGWDTDDLYNLQNLALVHDIGKIGVPDTIFKKKGPLTAEEFENVKKHTLVGKTILQDMTVIKKAAEVAVTHHERYDGKGYPHGLSGNNIPIESRIIAVADAFDAMTSDRAFRKHLNEEQLLAEFEKGKGTQFDPTIAGIAIDLIKEKKTAPSPGEVESNNDFSLESSKLLQKVLQEYTREIRAESQRDSLTGLWNRNFAADVVNEYLEDKRHSGCFFMIDIDGFKSINDTFGHIAGDIIIRQFAEILRESLRSDDIVCRIGGDEFVIFLKDTASRDVASAKAEEIILLLEKKLEKPDHTGHISASIGIAVAPVDGTDFNSLYAKADKALYYVKKNGKNSYHFFSEDNSAVLSVKRSTRIDMDYLRHFIQEKDTPSGAYHIEYDAFKKIYRFLSRVVKRTDSPVLTLLFTLTGKDNEIPAGSELDEALSHLKRAITTAIRSGDVATNYSSSQYIVILVDSTKANGYLVAERIRKLYLESSKSGISLSYDIDEIPH